MTRRFRTGRAPLWTMAGLTFLSGCGDASTDLPAASDSRALNVSAASADATKGRLAPRHTLDAQVIPVWYEFAAPPLPGAAPTDSHGAPGAAKTPAAAKGPTVVLPAAEDDAVTRLPVDVLDDAPEPPATRYDVGGRYAIDAATDAVAPLPAVEESAAAAPAPILVAPSSSEPMPAEAAPLGVSPLKPVETAEPISEPTLAPPEGTAASENARSEPEPAAKRHDAFRRLPPVDDAAAVESSAAPILAAPVEDAVPVAADDSPSAPDYEHRYERPSDVFAEEAQPVSRFQRLPPVEEAPRMALPTVVDASPANQDGQFLPPPVVLPPTITSRSVEQAPLVASAPPRLREMDLINERAGESVRAGYELAHRGALYSAQAEFATALRVIAQALDAQETTTRHAEALAAGLTALDESDDFLTGARSATTTVDVAAIVAKHRTPVLKDAPPEDLTPITALQRYYTYAQEQLAFAAEHEPAASGALYGMGKVQTTLQATRTGTLADGPKAIALHQAALLVDDRNFMAANELGVLLARCGRYDAARAALAHSVSISPQPAVWRNLAAVHERLGETSLAANARAAADSTARNMAQSPSASPASPQPVVWLDAATFAQSAQPQADLQRSQPTPVPEAAAPPPQTSDKKSGFRWPLW